MSSPAVHSVHFYDHDEALISRLQNIVSSSLESGSSVLIVATEEHRQQLALALEESGATLSTLPAGQLQMLDAREVLAKFMVHGLPNQKRFLESVGTLIASAREAAHNATRGLTIFGEMVAVLWSEGNTMAALELERLWNDLLHDRSFHLHCAYPRWILKSNLHNLTIKSICDEHSSVLGFAPSLSHSVATQ